MPDRDPFESNQQAQFDFFNLIEDVHSQEEKQLNQIQTKEEELSHQVRNLLLLYPLTRLEADKLRLGPETLSLFKGVDMLYLSFAMFDYISECMLFDMGAQRERIIQHLGKEVKRIKPRLSKKNAALAGEIVLDQLCNSRENHQSFSFAYFDASKESNMTRKFRLVLYQIGDDDEGRYHLTKEGFAAYLSMLELDTNMAQEVDEYLIQKLIDHGNFDDALRVAARNRKRTIELKDALKRKLFKLNRDIFNVSWQDEIKPFLKSSRDHIQARIKEEGNMLDHLDDHLIESQESEKNRLLKLQNTIQECQTQHRELHKEIMGFNEKFLSAQSKTYRTPRISNLADLEADILTLMGNKRVEELSAIVPEITSTMNSPVIKKVFDPLMLISVIDDLDQEDLQVEKKTESDVVTLNTPMDRFDNEMILEMEAYLKKWVPPGTDTDLKAIIARAEFENLFSSEQILCLIYLVFQWYGNADRSPGFIMQKSKKAKLSPKISKAAYLSGDNLTIRRGQ